MKRRYYLLLIILLIIVINGIMAGTVEASSDKNSIKNVTSEEYIVSKENSTIGRILPETTIDTVKKSFNVDSSTVHVYDKEGNQEISQGYIGTGMQIKFDNHETTYIVSVVGDLTGNGKIQQIEVSNVIKHIIGLRNYQLTGVKAVSADVSADGIINQKDISILIKYIVFGRLDIGELTKPTAPEIEITEGTDGENDWFTSNVGLKIKQPQISPIPIVGLSYEITGPTPKELSFIKNEETIELTEDGIYEIKCYSITAVGEKSELNTKTIKIDKTAPQSIELNPVEVKGSSIHLQISAVEEASGIDLYQIYVDEELYREIESNNNVIELDIIDLSSKPHDIKVIVKDLAGNENSASKQIDMGRMSLEDIEYVEFVVDNFVQTKGSQTVNSGASYIISDTSTSNVAKYIQVNSEDSGVKGELTGIVRIVRKSGEIVNEFKYYPENLVFEILQYSYGSGSTWSHEASINMINTMLSNADIKEGTTTKADIDIKQNSNNTFSVTDKKESGTKTYTRLIIDNVTLNGEKVMFKITNDNI